MYELEVEYYMTRVCLETGYREQIQDNVVIKVSQKMYLQVQEIGLLGIEGVANRLVLLDIKEILRRMARLQGFVFAGGEVRAEDICIKI